MLVNANGYSGLSSGPLCIHEKLTSHLFVKLGINAYIVVQVAFICDCKIRGPVFNPHALSFDVSFWDLLLLSNIPSLCVLNTRMFLDRGSITDLICVFVLCSQKLENLSNFLLDDDKSLLESLWSYVLIVLGTKIKL